MIKRKMQLLMLLSIVPIHFSLLSNTSTQSQPSMTDNMVDTGKTVDNNISSLPANDIINATTSFDILKSDFVEIASRSDAPNILQQIIRNLNLPQETLNSVYCNLFLYGISRNYQTVEEIRDNLIEEGADAGITKEDVEGFLNNIDSFLQIVKSAGGKPDPGLLVNILNLAKDKAQKSEVSSSPTNSQNSASFSNDFFNQDFSPTTSPIEESIQTHLKRKDQERKNQQFDREWDEWEAESNMLDEAESNMLNKKDSLDLMMQQYPYNLISKKSKQTPSKNSLPQYNNDDNNDEIEERFGVESDIDDLLDILKLVKKNKNEDEYYNYENEKFDNFDDDDITEILNKTISDTNILKSAIRNNQVDRVTSMTSENPELITKEVIQFAKAQLPQNNQIISLLEKESYDYDEDSFDEYDYDDEFAEFEKEDALEEAKKFAASATKNAFLKAYQEGDMKTIRSILKNEKTERFSEIANLLGIIDEEDESDRDDEETQAELDTLLARLPKGNEGRAEMIQQSLDKTQRELDTRPELQDELDKVLKEAATKQIQSAWRKQKKN